MSAAESAPAPDPDAVEREALAKDWIDWPADRRARINAGMSQAHDAFDRAYHRSPAADDLAERILETIAALSEALEALGRSPRPAAEASATAASPALGPEADNEPRQSEGQSDPGTSFFPAERTEHQVDDQTGDGTDSQCAGESDVHGREGIPAVGHARPAAVSEERLRDLRAAVVNFPASYEIDDAHACITACAEYISALEQCLAALPHLAPGQSEAEVREGVAYRIETRLEESRDAASTTLAADWRYRQGLMDAASIARTAPAEDGADHG